MWPIPYDNTGVTVELRELVENGVDIWDFYYAKPRGHFEVNGKTVFVPFIASDLQKKIVDHYYFRQIGSETPARWLHQFQTRMREIMPYYAQLYEFEAKWFAIQDPLESYNLTETYRNESNGEVESRGESGSTASTQGDMTRRFSDTPQGKIENINTYLTEATVEDTTGSESSSGTSSAESTTSNSETYTLTRRGNIGVQPLGTEVRDIRAAFINIDAMVIAELADLFLKIY